MGDRFTIDMGRKLGTCVPFGKGELGLHVTQCGLGRGLPTYQVHWHLDSCSRLATIDMSRKLGALPPFGKRELGPIQHNVVWVEAYLHTNWHLNSSSR